jgi:hypothetical protein
MSAGTPHTPARSRGRLDEAQDLLLSLQREPQGDDHRILRKRLPIDDHGHEFILVQEPLTEGPQVASAGPDEAAVDVGGTQPKGWGRLANRNR